MGLTVSEEPQSSVAVAGEDKVEFMAAAISGRDSWNLDGPSHIDSLV